MPLPRPHRALAARYRRALARVAAWCLARLTPGRQPLALFTQLSRLAVLCTVEVCLLRRGGDGEVEVLMTRRPDTCPWWPGQWHVPGTVLLADDADDDLTTPTLRLLAAETGGAVELRGPVRCFEARRRTGPRGRELTAFCWAPARVADGAELPADCAFLPARDLLARRVPSGSLIDGHEDTIRGLLAAAPRLV